MTQQHKIQPKYMRLAMACEYCSVSREKFLNWIRDDKMHQGFYPDGRGLNKVRLWDVADIDACMEDMKREPEENEWDQIYDKTA